jgi:predicted AlkP superfamily phosphohydrolase/phosphomutase
MGKTESPIRFKGMSIVRWEVVRNGEPRIQVQDYETGALYEIGMAASVNINTNELELHAIYHYSDPDSQPWFSDSSPWPKEIREHIEKDDS